MATLPQTNPAGGPNPNSSYNTLSVLDLPSMGGSTTAALTGAARARAQTALYGGSPEASDAIAGPMGMPGYDPTAPNLVNTPANGVQPQTGADWLKNLIPNALGASPQSQFDRRVSMVGASPHNALDAISNWWSNAPGTPEAKAYDAQENASATLRRPEAQAYFGQHPSLLAHAEADPVGFAQKLGPILDAAVSASKGGVQPGTIMHSTLDGPMGKPDNNPAMTNAHAAAFGVTPQVAHAATQPHHYTDQEYLQVMRGTSRGALKNMWEMQHYLNPQQQAMSLALSMGAQQAGGKVLDPAAAQYYKMLQAMATGGNYPLIGMAP